MPVRKRKNHLYKSSTTIVTEPAPKERGTNSHQLGWELGMDATLMCDLLTTGKYHNRDNENKWRSQANKK
ncbi:hypothetical protein LCGC14_0938080 [marine sediment metagenome]|uniref:Uncharacterized protein n=1 Tax=marine sediment metagenome TaxID=412755 RepID=A0A0F9P6Z6_9ZZZZ|nr:hypothetical protein [bacterium]